MTRRAARNGGDTTDLTVVVGWLVLSWLVVAVPPLRTSFIRALVVVPTALFVPGYACLSALSPYSDEDRSRSPIVAVERLLFAVSVSVAIAILVGIGLLTVGGGVTATATLAVLSVITLGGVFGAFHRRGSPHFTPSWSRPSIPSFERIRRPTDRQPVALTVVVLVVVAGALGAVGTVTLLGFHDPSGYAELAIEPTGGSANGTALSFEEADAVRVSITHQRPGTTDYTVLVFAQRTESTTDGDPGAERRIDGFAATLNRGESWSTRHRPNVSSLGTPGRVVYRLYRADDPTSDRAPRAQVQFWTNASDATDASVTASATASNRSTGSWDP